MKDALDLPAWEFEAKLAYARKHQARQALELYQVVSVASWGDKESRKEYMNEMKGRAGYKPQKKQETTLPTQEELKGKVSKFLAQNGLNIPMVGR